LVFSVLSLSVAKRAQQFALLGVLGMTGRERLWLVLVESGLLGLLGSALGLLLGTGLAALALRVLGGDLGGGYFAGVAPPLQFSLLAALAYGALGVAACLVGGWWPARAAQGLPPAQTLKGLGAAPGPGKGQRLSLALIAAGAGLAALPPVFGIPLAAYVSVALLLVGGITALPWLVALLYDKLTPLVAHQLLPLLAVERARRCERADAHQLLQCREPHLQRRGRHLRLEVGHAQLQTACRAHLRYLSDLLCSCSDCRRGLRLALGCACTCTRASTATAARNGGSRWTSRARSDILWE
jgi:putative ABC transport system permease protein